MTADRRLSPLAIASRDLVVRVSTGAGTKEVEAGCRELLIENTKGLRSVDTRVVDVAGEIVRGVVTAVTALRSQAITAAVRGVCETGEPGEAGDAERLSLSERTCRDVRDNENASHADYDAALQGAAPAARMSVEELHRRIARIPSPA